MKRYAIFFPQFYRIAINDLAWGHGFTDWVLVAGANAFNNWDRRCPAAGFYDLSKESDIHHQIDLACSYGLDGFAIYHYRFDDGPELDAVERYLQGHILPGGFQYFFVWANESWSKRWAGEDTRMLKHSSGSPDRGQISSHVRYLRPHMESESYTRLNGNPMFVVYRPDTLEDLPATLEIYRDEFHKVGITPAIGLFIKNRVDAQYCRHFDFCYLFEPRLFFNSQGVRSGQLVQAAYKELMRVIPYDKLEWLSESINRLLVRGSRKHSFAEFLSYFTSSKRDDFVESLTCPAQNVLTCGWNNAPRYRHRFTAVDVPSSDEFNVMLKHSLDSKTCSSEVPLLCNAWNEWSEGAALEPCSYLGDRLLTDYLRGDES
jgi:hypothetical protein